MKKVYIFQDCRDNFYYGEFETREAAMSYSYRHGLCFIGSTIIPDREGSET